MDACKLFPVDSTSDEAQKVAESFFKTLPHKIIDTIERIENGVLQESFVVAAGNIRKQLNSSDPAGWGCKLKMHDPATILKELFHGTSAVEMIVNSTDGHGFLPMLAGTAVGAIWGDGTVLVLGTILQLLLLLDHTIAGGMLKPSIGVIQQHASRTFAFLHFYYYTYDVAMKAHTLRGTLITATRTLVNCRRGRNRCLWLTCLLAGTRKVSKE